MWEPVLSAIRVTLAGPALCCIVYIICVVGPIKIVIVIIIVTSPPN